jgi:putative transcriptional regulator
LSDIANSGNISASDELTIIAGSVVLSDSPAHQLKYWRKRFGIKQADLARKMNITPSVLSDYEKGRRPSPGVNFIKRYLVALAELRKEGVAADEQATPEVAAAPVADAHINQN